MANPPTSKTPVYAPVPTAQGGNQPGTVRVDYVRPELTGKLEQYVLIDDCIAGGIAVKNKGITYLPMPDAGNLSEENKARYTAYKTRAVFYGVSQLTLAAFVGAVFEVDPVVKVPELLDSVVKDADGSGVSLVQLAQAVERAVLSKGRAGLRVDFPRTEGVTTRQDQLDGKVRPTIHHYHPADVINWRTKTVNNKTILSLVVLREKYETYDDGFAVTRDDQYRVLRLNADGNYIQEIWKFKNNAPDGAPEITLPVGSDGNPLKELPFTFVGAIDNSPSVDDPPMYSLCDLNLAHYRNSADYEESVYMTGQSTPVVTGLDENWYVNILKGKITLGSLGGIGLPQGANAELLQMDERTAAFAAMEHKEKQMTALGAKLVESKQVQRTATESSSDTQNEKSVLRTVTDNVSAAFSWALQWAAIFQGVTSIIADEVTDDLDANAIVFKLNTDFKIAIVSTDEMNNAMNAWQKEAISYTEMRNKLKQGGLAYLDDEKAKAEIQAMRMDIGDTAKTGAEAAFKQVAGK